jgi:hypothetical protein
MRRNINLQCLCDERWRSGMAKYRGHSSFSLDREIEEKQSKKEKI